MTRHINCKIALIFVLAVLACPAQTVNFQAGSPTGIAAKGSSTPVALGTVTSSPSGQFTVVSDLEPLAWLPTGTSCSPKQGSVQVTTPSSVSVCIDPAMPSGTHFLFFEALTAGVNAFGALPLTVTPAGSVTVDPSNVSLSGLTTSEDVNVTVAGAAKIQSVVVSNAQPGVGNWLSSGGACAGVASCKATITANPNNLASPVPGTTYLGRVTFTANDGTVGEVLVQYQFEPQGTTPVIITSPSTLKGFVDETFNATLSASGGTGPYTWSATGLPNGVNISSAGVLSGSVSSAGSTQATVKAQDALGATQSQVVTLVFSNQATAIPTQVFPHVAADPGGWQTDIILVNTSAAPVAFTLRFHTDTGAALAIEGIGAVQQLSSTIAAHGTAFYRTNATTTSDGWAEVNSAVPLSGVAVFRLHAADGNYYEASDALSTPGRSFTVPFDSTAFAGTSGYLTGLAVANADPTQKAQLTCTVYASNGSVAASSLQGPNLNASGHTAFLLQETAPFKTVSAGARGQLMCTSTAAVSAIALRALKSSVSSLPVLINQ